MRIGPAVSFMIVVAVGVGCERAPEADHLSRIRDLCGEVATTGAGAAEAEQLFGPPTLLVCASDLPPASSADSCPRDGTIVCVRVFAYRARNDSLCGGTACSYGCEIRAPQSNPEATCSVRFLDGFETPGLAGP